MIDNIKCLQRLDELIEFDKLIIRKKVNDG
jgi:hypothetical protein